ncbi:hypothetical protein DPMN_150836 [Dreissena polymorpha]|uniref:Uncharacterized protein n=1 Tax=Dreissena polymorpha TaxID=45954 RepID=A0A9D4FE10_DREPO|nr:hypothetical protein DPMN_150836 [Dreissena polymorpha]
MYLFILRGAQIKSIFSSAETATVTDNAVTRIRTWVVAATTRSANRYTITAERAELAINIVINNKIVTLKVFMCTSGVHLQVVPASSRRRYGPTCPCNLSGENI